MHCLFVVCDLILTVTLSLSLSSFEICCILIYIFKISQNLGTAASRVECGLYGLWNAIFTHRRCGSTRQLSAHGYRVLLQSTLRCALYYQIIIRSIWLASPLCVVQYELAGAELFIVWLRQ